MNNSLLCRVCLEAGTYSLNDYQVELNSQKFTAAGMLLEFSSKEFSNSDDIPAMICAKCSDELIQSFIFLYKLRNADESIEVGIFAETEDPLQEHDNLDSALDFKEDNDMYDCVEVEEEKILGQEDINATNDEDHDYLPATDLKSNLAESPLPPAMPELIQRKSSSKKQRLKEPANKKQKITYEDVSSGRSYVISAYIPSAKTDLPPSCEEAVVKEASVIENRSKLTNNVATPADEVRTLDFAAIEVDSTDHITLNTEDLHPITNGNKSTVYQCQYCPKAYSYSDFLVAHLTRTHVCQHCREIFKGYKELNEHIREQHKFFQCVICSSTKFKTNSNLRQHMRQYHKMTLPRNVVLLGVNKHEEGTLPVESAVSAEVTEAHKEIIAVTEED